MDTNHTNFYFCGEKTFQLHFIEKNNIEDEDRIIKLKICCVNFNCSSFSWNAKYANATVAAKKRIEKEKVEPSGTTNWKKEKARMKHVVLAWKLFSFIN